MTSYMYIYCPCVYVRSLSIMEMEAVPLTISTTLGSIAVSTAKKRSIPSRVASLVMAIGICLSVSDGWKVTLMAMAM